MNRCRGGGSARPLKTQSRIFELALRKLCILTARGDNFVTARRQLSANCWRTSPRINWGYGSRPVCVWRIALAKCPRTSGGVVRCTCVRSRYERAHVNQSARVRKLAVAKTGVVQMRSRNRKVDSLASDSRALSSSRSYESYP